MFVKPMLTTSRCTEKYSWGGVGADKLFCKVGSCGVGFVFLANVLGCEGLAVY